MKLLAHYVAPEYAVPSVHLSFDLHPSATKVVAKLKVIPGSDRPIILHGHNLKPEQVLINDQPAAYRLHDNGDLELEAQAAPFTLTTSVIIDPSDNTGLEGLYLSNGLYCTQCEPHGFRRITFFPDRPDVSSVYTVTVTGDLPVLLSNGNLTAEEATADGRRSVTWHDPFPKPSYLFALAAGDLKILEDHFVTSSGKKVLLQIYTEEAYADRCDFAMDSLKRAMAWDESTYGLEYDLDRFMILAVSHFNMGAMENKGLNIFNIKYIAASTETATDADYAGIESVVAHEYFHNYTGNRVTCRDWFQLCLKEGLTVFRDQQFSAAMRGEALQRADDVSGLRASQFPEDAGPLRHPVRPSEYREVNNLYTATVYEKGAEICRMLSLVVGEERFAAAVAYYLRKHDGGAATIEDFITAISEHTKVDLSPFTVWYTHSGTPILTVTPIEGGVHLKQSMPDSSDTVLRPIPVRYGSAEDPQSDGLLILDTAEAELLISGTPSLLRGFSAPVKLEFNESDDALLQRLANDSDLFNRFDAAETVAIRLLTAERADDARAERLCAALLNTLSDTSLPPAERSRALRLPPLSILMQQGTKADPQKLFAAREALANRIATRGQGLLRLLATGAPHDIDPDPEAAGRRSLRNAALAYVNRLEINTGATASDRYYSARCMSDRMAGLHALLQGRSAHRATAIVDFYLRYRDDANTLDKWFSAQAMAAGADASVIAGLAEDPLFTYDNPNRVRSLFGVFAHGNLPQFCTAAGTALIARTIAGLDKHNPQAASRLAQSFEILHRLPRPVFDIKAFALSREFSHETGDILTRIANFKTPA